MALDTVGWHDRTTADHQQQLNTWAARGYRTISLSVYGDRGDPRYAAVMIKRAQPVAEKQHFGMDAAIFTAIWGTREDHDARTWRMTGSPGIAAIDDEVKAIMSAGMIRGGSIAITLGTRLVYARGYTFAEPGYPDVQPTTTFRQASVSKTFCAAAIWQLIESGALHLTDKFHDKLPLAPQGGSLAANWNVITIKDLLEMTAGVTASILGTDPNASSNLPISAMQMAEWLASQALGNMPGDKTQANYSNASYMLLGVLVAKLWGKPSFIEAIHDDLLAPLHMTHTRAATTRVDKQPANEARYHSRPLQTSNSVMVSGQPLCALGYGEWNLENSGGGGGLSASAVDVARLVAALSMTKDGPLMKYTTLQQWLGAAASATATLSGPSAHGYHGFDGLTQSGSTFSGDKGGSLTTSNNAFWVTTGGIGVVLCWNTPPSATGPTWYPNDPTILSVAGSHDWGAADLFATAYGMPSLDPAVPHKAPISPLKPLPPMSGGHMMVPEGRPMRM